MSRSAAELFGYTVDQLLIASGNSAKNMICYEDRASALNSMKNQLAYSGRYSVKYRIKCRNGNIKWVVDSGKRVKNEDGESFLYSFYQDVTELEERNIKLREALSMNTMLIDSVGCGIFSYRLPRRDILAFNDEARRLFGIESSEADNAEIIRVMRENILPEDLTVMSNAVKVLKKPGDRTSYDIRIRHKSGRIHNVSINSDLLEFEDGGKFILSSMLDVTEQTNLNAVIREERSQYRDALLTNCEYAYSFDLSEGFITEEYVTKHGTNPFRKMGLTVPIEFDRFVSEWKKSFEPQFLTDDMEKRMSRSYLLKRFASGERKEEVEYYSPVSDTYTRVTSLLSRSERNGNIMAVIVGTDTTESRRREERSKQALSDAYEAAKRASSAKSDFLSRMSHDIRTPMNAIIGMTAIAGTHLDDRERVSDCLSKITASSGHLLSLINEVLDMSKIESGKVDLSEEAFNLSDLIDALISMVRPQVSAKNQNLNIAINDIAHEKVIGDKLRIQQSFLNLMSNAVKYTGEGGNINLYISEKPLRSPRVAQYEFIFEDNGIGMTPEFVEHIFEPFSRAADSRVSKTQGTGLGMAITDNLVRMMDGNIKVESEPGKGSKFTVTISLKLQDAEEISYSEFTDLSVLVADDEQSTCERACAILNEIGMNSEWVLDGRSAVEKVVQRREEGRDFFAVIIDWKMPDMDGIQTTREIRRTVGSDIPIIIISAYDWSEIEPEARAAGADAFISKPLFKSRLAHLFHELVSGESKVSRSEAEISADELRNCDFSGKRVLLVEDNDLNSEIAKELLEMTGLEVDCAENGRAAADMFSASENGCYSMIFMDVQMPIMNGNEAARAIRAMDRRDAKSIPIVAMTANAFSEDVRESLSAGMNEHIAKPLSLKQLVKTLERWIG